MLEQFTAAYIEAMLWADEPEEETWNVSDISDELRATIDADCKAFLDKAGELINAEPCTRVTSEYTTAEQAGHDFWLTRQGHGAGFWDGDWPTQGDTLTAICKEFGECYVYQGDDGKLYA